MTDKKDLWSIIDGMSQPLYQAQGAANLLFRLCDTVDREKAQMFAFIAAGLERDLKDVHARYEAAHAAVSKVGKAPAGPRAVS